jgi:hypothetical protein
MWQGHDALPSRYLLVLNEPPGNDPSVVKSVSQECSSLRDGPTLRYAFAGPPVTTFYTKWCERSGSVK